LIMSGELKTFEIIGGVMVLSAAVLEGARPGPGEVHTQTLNDSR